MLVFSLQTLPIRVAFVDVDTLRTFLFSNTSIRVVKLEVEPRFCLVYRELANKCPLRDCRNEKPLRGHCWSFGRYFSQHL